MKKYLSLYLLLLSLPIFASSNIQISVKNETTAMISFNSNSWFSPWTYAAPNQSVTKEYKKDEMIRFF